jgi:hypothetical protein
MTTEEIIEALAAPFDPDEVKWKPGKVSGNRAMALAYVNARVVQDRLDDVMGPANWKDEYIPVGNGTFLCRLSVRLDGEWITKMDVGGESEQTDEGDRTKAAVSDALKRAAVKFGIGRYLYRFPHQWADFDPQKKQFVKTPILPPWAVPKRKPAAAAPVTRADWLPKLQRAAISGMVVLESLWKRMPQEARSACKDDLPALKTEAAKYAGNTAPATVG